MKPMVHSILLLNIIIFIILLIVINNYNYSINYSINCVIHKNKPYLKTLLKSYSFYKSTFAVTIKPERERGKLFSMCSSWFGIFHVLKLGNKVCFLNYSFIVFKFTYDDFEI